MIDLVSFSERFFALIANKIAVRDGRVEAVVNKPEKLGLGLSPARPARRCARGRFVKAAKTVCSDFCAGSA